MITRVLALYAERLREMRKFVYNIMNDERQIGKPHKQSALYAHIVSDYDYYLAVAAALSLWGLRELQSSAIPRYGRFILFQYLI